MAKLTYEDKKEIIKLYNEDHLGYGTIAKKFNVSESVIRYLVSKYNLHGESILIKDRNKVLSLDTKLEIINRLKKGEPQKWRPPFAVVHPAWIILAVRVC